MSPPSVTHHLKASPLEIPLPGHNVTLVLGRLGVLEIVARGNRHAASFAVDPAAGVGHRRREPLLRFRGVDVVLLVSRIVGFPCQSSSGTYLARTGLGGLKATADVHKLWCAVLGLKQDSPVMDNRC
jgi:hypothetical protein